jgi:hypothetical protein
VFYPELVVIALPLFLASMYNLWAAALREPGILPRNESGKVGPAAPRVRSVAGSLAHGRAGAARRAAGRGNRGRGTR